MQQKDVVLVFWFETLILYLCASVQQLPGRNYVLPWLSEQGGPDPVPHHDPAHSLQLQFPGTNTFRAMNIVDVFFFGLFSVGGISDFFKYG